MYENQPLVRGDNCTAIGFLDHTLKEDCPTIELTDDTSFYVLKTYRLLQRRLCFLSIILFLGGGPNFRWHYTTQKWEGLSS